MSLAEPKRRGRPRSQDARRAILRAAIDLLGAEALAAISADAIAERAGVSKATIYRWWPNKSAIIMEAFLEMMTPHIAFPETGSAFADLTVQINRIVETYGGESGRLFHTLVAESQSDAELGAALWTRYFSIRREQARRVIERGMASGEFRPDLDVETAIDVLYGPLLYRYMIAPAPPDAAFVGRMMALLGRALLKA